MIEAVEGDLGAGKTLSTVMFRIAPQLAAGGMVFTNVEIIWEGMREAVMKEFGVIPVPEQLVFLSKEELCDFDEHIKWGNDKVKVLVVLDEIHLWFDQGMSRDFDKRLMQFLTQSRKADVDLTYITQDVLNVSVPFRRLMLQTWRWLDLEAFTIPGWGPVIKGWMIGVCVYKNGKTVLRRKMMRKNPMWFGAYRTKALLKDLVEKERAKVFELERVHKASVFERMGIPPRDLVVIIAGALAGVLLALKFTVHNY